jgi:hypothetical protein
LICSSSTSDILLIFCTIAIARFSPDGCNQWMDFECSGYMYPHLNIHNSLVHIHQKKIAPKNRSKNYKSYNLVPRACDPREGTRGSEIIRCRKPGILAKIELRIPYQRPIRFLPETDYPRASRSFPRITGSGNEISSLIARKESNPFHFFRIVAKLIPFETISHSYTFCDSTKRNVYSLNLLETL